MAGPSSEAGYVNIGTAENSSHPETEPEIEDVEATGDSDEVCGLERKECDHIMEHLKNNPGLAVQSLGPEGRIVLHVAVMAGETKKPKPPAPICTEKGFSEAAVGSEWYRALKRKDCNVLMALLEANPCLVAQTDPEGRTVVHAAAQRGCLELLDQVFDLFKDNDHFVDEMSGVKVALDDLGRAKCGTFEAEAHHMAWFKCPVRVWRFLRNGGRKKSTERFSSDAQHSAQYLTDELVEIMQQKPPKEAFKSLERTYQQDLNYNFVLVREELQFHYACSRMIKRPAERVKTPAAEYVKTVIDGCRELEPTKSESELLTHLFQLHNAQGQTPLHLVLKGDTATLLKLLPLGDEYKECLNARDARGWTALHCAAATGNKEAIKALLEDERVDVNARTCTHRDRYYENKPEEAGMTALHLAILHDDVSSVELLLECPYTNVNALLRRQIGCGCEKIMRGDAGKGFHLNELYWSPLQLAAIMGLSDVVRALLGSKRLDIYDEGKLQKINITMENDFQRISALLLASASGNPDVLQLFLESQMFDPLVKFKGATALHYATNAMIPRAKKNLNTKSLVASFTFQILDIWISTLANMRKSQRI